MISNEPKRTLPHREPFLWVSRLIERSEDGKHGLVELDLPESLDVFRGHFPGNPIFPGVIQCEAAAQACLWISVGVLPPGSNLPDGRFVAIEEYKFKRPVVPPAVLRIEGREVAARSRLHLWEVTIRQNDAVVSQGSFWLHLAKDTGASG